MAKKWDEFVDEYYKRLIFLEMPAAQFSRFCDIVKSKDFTGNQKYWARDLLEKDAAGEYKKDAHGILVRKELPDPTSGEYELDDNQWADLFNAFRDAFMKMASNRGSLVYNDPARNFLDKYYGDGKLFQPTKATDETEKEITLLQRVLSDNESTLRYVVDNGGIISYDDLTKGLGNGKYNKDPEFRDKVISIASSWLNTALYGSDPNAVRAALNNSHVTIDYNLFKNIRENFDNKAIDDGTLVDFKTSSFGYDKLLRDLYTNSKAFEVFKAYDTSKISKKLDEAKNFLDYDNKDSKDFVPPKRQDELSDIEKLKDAWAETYSNYLKKYLKLTGDRMFASPNAEYIFKAIDKEKIKPTDGLDKILASASAITDRVRAKNNKAADHFKWMTGVLGDLKKDMPKAFAGALSHGNQMRALVEEIITKAINNNPQKIAEAKTAMEVLSVMHYGYTTSKIMDALGKENLDLFSGLSWNNNSGTRLVTTAMTKSIKAALMGIGYGFTMAGNIYNLSRNKFKGKSKRLANERTKWADKTSAERATIVADRDRVRATSDAEIARHQATLTGLGADYTSDKIADREADRATLKGTMDRYAVAHNMFQENQQIVDDYKTMTDLAKRINDLDVRIKPLEAKYNAGIKLTDAELDDYTQWTGERQLLAADMPDVARQQYLIANNAYATAYINDPAKQADNKAYTDASDKYNEIGAKITDFKNATAKIAEEKKRQAEHDEKIANWDENNKDKYRELMAYWDFLETGRNTHTGKLYSWSLGSAKKKQKNFNGNALFQEYLNAYGHTA